MDCSTCSRFDFLDQLILFGVKPNVQTDKAMDLLILWAKFYIYKCKFQDSKPVLEHFRTVLKFRYKTEKYLAYMIGRGREFLIEWMPYTSLVVN